MERPLGQGPVPKRGAIQSHQQSSVYFDRTALVQHWTAGQFSTNDDLMVRQHPDPFEPFPLKTHFLLEKESVIPQPTDIVQWLPHGRAFKICDQRRLVVELLPQYFKRHSTYRSFRYQLDTHGFIEIDDSHVDCGAYYHEYFVRGLPLLSRSIQRTVPVAHPHQHAPNFYQMKLPLEGYSKLRAIAYARELFGTTKDTHDGSHDKTTVAEHGRADPLSNARKTCSIEVYKVASPIVSNIDTGAQDAFDDSMACGFWHDPEAVALLHDAAVESSTTRDVIGLHPSSDSNNGDTTSFLLGDTDLECNITAEEQLLLPDECVDTAEPGIAAVPVVPTHHFVLTRTPSSEYSENHPSHTSGHAESVRATSTPGLTQTVACNASELEVPQVTDLQGYHTLLDK